MWVSFLIGLVAVTYELKLNEEKRQAVFDVMEVTVVGLGTPSSDI
jgi:hypothetical protein